jgi:hypothetical protein
MPWSAASGPLTDGERYTFDLQGFIVRRGALTANEVRMLRLAVVDLGLPRPGPTLDTQRFSGHLARDQAFRELLDHRGVLEPLIELCGPTVRLDHTYGITMAPGSGGLGLHGGATPYDPSQHYRVVDGRMYNGLVAVQWALVDHRRGDGGFGCIPGSHKAGFFLPPQPDPSLVAEVSMSAGDVVIFTEALTHCTIPWRGPMDRLSLLYKYSPGHMAWGQDDGEGARLAPLLSERQRRLMQRPTIHGHQPVQPG